MPSPLRNNLGIFVAVFVLPGCASLDDIAKVEPYLEVGIGIQLEGETDYWIQTSRSWQCESPNFDAEVGLEWSGGLACGIHHRSWVLCGTGLNDKPEVYSNDLRCRKRFGGWQRNR